MFLSSIGRLVADHSQARFSYRCAADRSTGVTRGLRYIHTLAQPTLSELFTEIAANLEPASAWARVDYDPQWHFPINATGDVVDRTDSKWTLIVRNFRPM